VTSGELSSILGEAFRPVANAEETLAKATSRVPEQLLVSWAGRAVVIGIVVLAAIGARRGLRARALDRATLVIALAPASLPLVTSFGGEAVFRVFLFALPGLSLMAACAFNLEPRSEPGTSPRVRLVPVAATVASVVLLAGFLLAYYGKDQQYYFTPEEVAASEWIADHAPAGSLLVEGSGNYPKQFRNYERFTYVAIASEPTSSWRRVLADPAGRLDTWLSDRRYRRALLLITRSQKIDTDTLGPLPEGSLERIERALRSSTAFRVAYQNRDAVVFESASAAP
jgi:hypothetical protein